LVQGEIRIQGKGLIAAAVLSGIAMPPITLKSGYAEKPRKPYTFCRGTGLIAPEGPE
jgi:hypothetical protein